MKTKNLNGIPEADIKDDISMRIFYQDLIDIFSNEKDITKPAKVGVEEVVKIHEKYWYDANYSSLQKVAEWVNENENLPNLGYNGVNYYFEKYNLPKNASKKTDRKHDEITQKDENIPENVVLIDIANLTKKPICMKTKKVIEDKNDNKFNVIMTIHDKKMNISKSYLIEKDYFEIVKKTIEIFQKNGREVATDGEFSQIANYRYPTKKIDKKPISENYQVIESKHRENCKESVYNYVYGRKKKYGEYPKDIEVYHQYENVTDNFDNFEEDFLLEK